MVGNGKHHEQEESEEAKDLSKSGFQEEARSETIFSEEAGELLYINPSLAGSEHLEIKENQPTKHKEVDFKNATEKFSVDIRKDIATVENIFGFYAPPIQQREFVGPIQSYAQVKEHFSNTDPVLIKITKNKIILENVDVNVTPTNAIDDDFPEESWEVTEGYDILKLLNPQPRIPTKVSAHTDLRHLAGLVSDPNHEVFGTDTMCSEFLSPESAAKGIVKDTILSATCEMKRRILEYGSHKPSYKDILQHQKLYSYWPSIRDFKKEQGKVYIKTYIDNRNHFFEDWKYNIFFCCQHSDSLSHHYIYEVIFGLPTKMYPIPQVTASLFFFMEASRVLPSQCPIEVTISLETSRRRMDPRKFFLRDNILLKILDEKITNFKTINF
ncbi:unnamed protein product [Ceutorhynchus assimilis]|uniref:Uncharacterized protein n=1 Tax=Ceutorhynchus assimilis TaxID=467358 RepID=A0A9N9QMX8_9CUCU|nr:unnamed protein product [Ceutorhynchus assimilis]